MKKNTRKILSSFLSLAIIISLLPPIFNGWVETAQAVVYADQSDTMTRLKVGTTADHTIAWTLPSGITFDVSDNTDTMQVDFDHTGGDAAFTQGGTWDPADFTLTANNGARTLTVEGVDTVAGANPDCTVSLGADNVCIAIDTTNLVFTIKPSATFTATTADQEFVLTIDGTASDGTLTNPVTAASYKTDLAICDEDAGPCTTTFTSTYTGALAVSIITDDQVVVSATVDPTITLTLSANTVNLGTLSTGSVSTATMTAQTQTNAINGYSATVLEDGELRNGANTIDDVADAAVTAGSEEYGLGTSDSGQTIAEDDDCNGTPSTAITGTAKTFGGETAGPVNETATLCFAASITDTTVAGAYSHTLTLISTGLF